LAGEAARVMRRPTDHLARHRTTMPNDDDRPRTERKC
jgi:hypothetical protein